MAPLILAFALAASPPLPHEQCASVFGDASVREANKARRETRLVDVVENKDGRAILHASPLWAVPKSLRLAGIELVGIEDPRDDRPAGARRVARIKLAGSRCPDGEYAVGVDSSLGQRARVVAVLDDSVLIELDDKLVRLGNGRNDLRMVWQSAFAITVAGGGSSARAKTTSAKTSARADTKEAAERLLERKERAKARAAKKAEKQ